MNRRHVIKTGIAAFGIGAAGCAAPTLASSARYEMPMESERHTPSLSEIAPAVERAGLFITDIEVLRMHYAETLAAWRRNFVAHREEALEVYDERFCRMFEFYLAGAELSFRHMGHMVWQMQVARRADSLPLTRDYMWEAERAAAQTQAEA